jgi:hypothetical protein
VALEVVSVIRNVTSQSSGDESVTCRVKFEFAAETNIAVVQEMVALHQTRAPVVLMVCYESDQVEFLERLLAEKKKGAKGGK